MTSLLFTVLRFADMNREFPPFHSVSWGCRSNNRQSVSFMSARCFPVSMTEA